MQASLQKTFQQLSLVLAKVHSEGGSGGLI